MADTLSRVAPIETSVVQYGLAGEVKQISVWVIYHYAVPAKTVRLTVERLIKDAADEGVQYVMQRSSDGVIQSVSRDGLVHYRHTVFAVGFDRNVPRDFIAGEKSEHYVYQLARLAERLED